MTIIHQTITLKTEPGINIHNITPQVKAILAATAIKNGHVIVFVRHTTTALAINEYEVRLLKDLQVYSRCKLFVDERGEFSSRKAYANN